MKAKVDTTMTAQTVCQNIRTEPRCASFSLRTHPVPIRAMGGDSNISSGTVHGVPVDEESIVGTLFERHLDSGSIVAGSK